ncbi:MULTISPECIES: hypothetical protein [Bacillaceae]|uniref:hypothetical protein n=1 Tax=Bacillaceae TaxID=186817 RepID=UPI0015DFCD83|nr:MULTISPECIES: hypothetical protein [Bacillaceae]QNG61488.1 hypothetical protein H4O14_08430 [Bacillus sp. PAMC26568]
MKNEHTTRISAEPSESPRLVIKTNLDASSPAEENPYYEKSDKEKAKAYFEEQ